MRFRLKTKITLIIALLVLAVVGANSWLYLATLTRQVIRQAEIRATLVEGQVFTQALTALNDAAGEGKAPASDHPEDVREYVRSALEQNSGLTSLIDAEVSDPLIYEVTILDRDGTAMISSDPTLPGRQVLSRPPLTELLNSGFIRQLRNIYRAPLLSYQTASPFKVGPPGQQVPFGEIRVAVQIALLRSEITPALYSAGLLAVASVLFSVLLAALVSTVSLAPLERLTAQAEAISRGEFDQKPLGTTDEFGQVSTRITQIGQQLRGVREIFSSTRENLDQVLAGLEDGLLLFTHGRAVVISPAVEHFLGKPEEELLGLMIGEIFPPDHPLRAALGMVGEQFRAVNDAEVEMPAAIVGAARRIGVSVQVIDEDGAPTSALVKLRNLESRERIGSELQLSGLARVTSGVAHEVKNPLNSMRLWLENLKENLPDGEELPRQAVAVLDSEIDRLDSVLKRFLDFMRPSDPHMEETRLEDLLKEIADIAGPQMRRSGVQLDTQFAAVPPVNVDRQLLKQALLNLIYNAIEAMSGGGRLTLGLARRGDSAQIRVSDTGRGIPPEQRGRVFQLFFTTKPRGVGNGIGLATAYNIVQLHNGAIDFDSEVGRGTTFRIQLPLAHTVEPVLSRVHHTTGPVHRSS
jgi:signal transduction histidine kinase